MDDAGGFTDVVLLPDMPDIVSAPFMPDVVSPADVPSLCLPNANGPSRTYDYLINRYIVNLNQTPGQNAQPVFGFNLDNAQSPARNPPEGPPHCGSGDWTSRLDPDQNSSANGAPCSVGSAGCEGGVDNILPALDDALSQFFAGASVESSLNERTSSGRDLWVLRVADVNGALDDRLCDPSVTLRLYRVYPLFTNCAMIGRPDAPYAIARNSLVDPTDPNSALFSFRAQIVNGRLRTIPSQTQDRSPSSQFALLGTFGFPGPLDVYSTQIRFSFAPNGALIAGNLGGYIQKQSIRSALRTFLPDFAAALEPLLDGFVDIALPLGSAGARCDLGGLSIGFGFLADRATLSGSILSAPAGGTCGSSP
jgi:hypothetical protein